MLSGTLIGILVAVGAGTWVYSKVMRRTGNNTQSAIISSVVTGIIVFFLILSFVTIADRIILGE